MRYMIYEGLKAFVEENKTIKDGDIQYDHLELIKSKLL